MCVRVCLRFRVISAANVRHCSLLSLSLLFISTLLISGVGESISAGVVWLTTRDAYGELIDRFLFHRHSRQEVDFCHRHPLHRPELIISRAAAGTRSNYLRDAVTLFLLFESLSWKPDKRIKMTRVRWGRYFDIHRYRKSRKKMWKGKREREQRLLLQFFSRLNPIVKNHCVGKKKKNRRLEQKQKLRFNWTPLINTFATMDLIIARASFRV